MASRWPCRLWCSSASEAFVITIEVVQMLRGEMEPARFSGTHGLLQRNFGTEGAITVSQVQNLGRVRHRHFDHVDRAWHTRGFTRAGEADVLRPQANGH